MKAIQIASLALGSLLVSFAASADVPLSNDEVKKVVESHLGDVKTCMRDKGSATGKLVVEFAIEPDGHVSNNKTKEASSNAALDGCIVAAFARWSFPKPRGGVVMGAIYPFMFAAAPPPPKPVVGKLSPQQIVDTVQSKVKEVKACFDANHVKETPAGIIEVAVVVSAAGAVKEATVKSSTMKAPKLDQCVVDRLKTWTFPKPEGNGEAAFVYPFAFKAD